MRFFLVCLMPPLTLQAVLQDNIMHLQRSLENLTAILEQSPKHSAPIISLSQSHVKIPPFEQIQQELFDVIDKYKEDPIGYFSSLLDFSHLKKNIQDYFDNIKKIAEHDIEIKKFTFMILSAAFKGMDESNLTRHIRDNRKDEARKIITTKLAEVTREQVIKTIESVYSDIDNYIASIQTKDTLSEKILQELVVQYVNIKKALRKVELFLLPMDLENVIQLQKWNRDVKEFLSESFRVSQDYMTKITMEGDDERLRNESLYKPDDFNRMSIECSILSGIQDATKDDHDKKLEMNKNVNRICDAIRQIDFRISRLKHFEQEAKEDKIGSFTQEQAKNSYVGIIELEQDFGRNVFKKIPIDIQIRIQTIKQAFLEKLSEFKDELEAVMKQHEKNILMLSIVTPGTSKEDIYTLKSPVVEAEKVCMILNAIYELKNQTSPADILKLCKQTRDALAHANSVLQQIR